MNYRAWHVAQAWLLPPTFEELLPAGHDALLVRDSVRFGIDMSPILVQGAQRGRPAHDPRMMTAVLLYAYTQRIYSAREIARACEERLDFAAITGLQRPDFRAVAEFRAAHLAQLVDVFLAALALWRQLGRGKTVEPIGERDAVAVWLAEAARRDRTENARAAARPTPPAWLADPEKRRVRLSRARAALERSDRAVA